MEACLATPPPPGGRVKRALVLLEGERESDVVELSRLAKDEGRSEVEPTDRNL